MPALAAGLSFILHPRAGLLELLEYHARRLLSVYVFGDDMQDTEVHRDWHAKRLES
jgi:hypothetical protein